MPFELPAISDNPEGWGPTSEIPKSFENVPYAPFNKNDRLGRACDWTSNYGRQNQNRFGQQGGRRGEHGRDTNAVFSYHHQEDDDFHMVDNKTVQKPRFFGQRRQWGAQGRGAGRAGFNQPGGRGAGRDGGRGAGRDGGRGGWKFNNYNRWNKPQRNRDSSVEVKPEWKMLEEINFLIFNKLSAAVPEPETIKTCGALEQYDKTFKGVTTRNSKKLERFEDRVFYKVSTSDDPILREMAAAEAKNGGGKVIVGTDVVIATLMAATRSVNSWDIIATHAGNIVYLDKRDNSMFDFLTVNETAHEPPEEDKAHEVNINSVSSLSQEATFINQNFSQQVLSRDEPLYEFEEKNPFSSPGEEVASVAYRYRKWALSGDITLIARCEIDGVMKDKDEQDVFLTIKALNEYDSKLSMTMDWRKKLDSQRGAVLATELKNNANKLAKWTIQSLLAGTDLMKIGYVSRAHPKDCYNHVILSAQFCKPKEFAQQIALPINNVWGVMKSTAELLFSQNEGKYVLMKDPNKAVVRLYEVPADAFDETAADDAGDVALETNHEEDDEDDF